jgi:hypothetical protein
VAPTGAAYRRDTDRFVAASEPCRLQRSSGCLPHQHGGLGALVHAGVSITPLILFLLHISVDLVISLMNVTAIFIQCITAYNSRTSWYCIHCRISSWHLRLHTLLVQEGLTGID